MFVLHPKQQAKIYRCKMNALLKKSQINKNLDYHQFKSRQLHEINYIKKKNCMKLKFEIILISLKVKKKIVLNDKNLIFRLLHLLQ